MSSPTPGAGQRIRAERERARKEREQAALDLHEAFLFGGPLEQERRQSAERHLAAAQHHEQTADEIERGTGP